MDLTQAFSGIKVLAVARIVAAPFAAYQLALHGERSVGDRDAEEQQRSAEDLG